jgi:glutamyl/glutaminyl-tRNA synthetase
VVNYLCLLGWSPKDNREKLSLAEVVERFDLPQILRHNARFDYEKLLWLQGEYARELATTAFTNSPSTPSPRPGWTRTSFPCPTSRPRSTPARASSSCSANCPPTPDFISPTKLNTTPRPQKRFRAREQTAPGKTPRRLCHAPAFNAATLEAALKETAKALGVKAGVLVHPCRLAVTGKTSGPSLYHLLEVLGKENYF